MVFIVNDCYDHYAHIWSRSGVSNCWRHLVTSKKSSNPFFRRKRPLLHHTCATCSELPSYLSTRVFEFTQIWFVGFSSHMDDVKQSRVANPARYWLDPDPAWDWLDPDLALEKYWTRIRPNLCTLVFFSITNDHLCFIQNSWYIYNLL